MSYTNEVLMVRSVDRKLGNASSFSVDLLKSYTNVAAVTLISAEIPYSFPNICTSYASNVTFTQSAPSALSVNYAVTPGQYTINDLTANLLAFLQASFPALSISAVNFSTITGGLTVIIGNNSGVLSVSKGSGATPSLCSVLGVDPTLTTSSVYANSVNSLTFSNAANLQPQSCLMIRILNMPSNVITTAGALGIFRVQVSSPPGSILFTNNATNINNSVQFASPIASISSLIVQVAGTDNTQIDFRGCEWVFSIKITYLS